jgi:hypothetical protein
MSKPKAGAVMNAKRKSRKRVEIFDWILIAMAFVLVVVISYLSAAHGLTKATIFYLTFPIIFLSLVVAILWQRSYGAGNRYSRESMMHIFTIQKECIMELRAQLRPKRELPEEDMKSEGLDFWSVYEKPDDFPTLFIARKFEWSVQTHQFLSGATLEDVRRQIPAGLTRLPCGIADDPKIIESWI